MIVQADGFDCLCTHGKGAAFGSLRWGPETETVLTGSAKTAFWGIRYCIAMCGQPCTRTFIYVKRISEQINIHGSKITASRIILSFPARPLLKW